MSLLINKHGELVTRIYNGQEWPVTGVIFQKALYISLMQKVSKGQGLIPSEDEIQDRVLLFMIQNPKTISKSNGQDESGDTLSV